VKTSAQHRAAARCRHARASEARAKFWRELSERLESSPHRRQPARFASCERRRIDAQIERLNDVFGTELKPSTFRTWIREWRKARAAGV
jgi:ribosomal protein L18E